MCVCVCVRESTRVIVRRRSASMFLSVNERMSVFAYVCTQTTRTQSFLIQVDFFDKLVFLSLSEEGQVEPWSVSNPILSDE